MTAAKTDLVIIGAGPAGMSAACEARAHGLTVVVLDEQSTAGGQIFRSVEIAPSDRVEILGKDYAAGRSLADAFKTSGAEYLAGAVVWNLTRDGTVDYLLNGSAQQVSGRYVLIASGAMERPFPIRGWTLPGVMGAGAGQILLKSSGALPTKPVVLAGCGPLLYLLAWQYLRAGVRVRALVDTTTMAARLQALRHSSGAIRGWRDLAKGIKLITALRKRSVEVYSGATGLAVNGEDRAESLSFEYRGRTVQIPADLLLIHQGVVPNTQLTWSLSVEHRWSDKQLCWLPITDVWGRLNETSIYVCGDSRAIVGAQASAIQGRLAALSIADQLNAITDLEARAAILQRQLRRSTALRPFLDTLYRPITENRVPPDDSVTVCRCEEVTAGEIRKYVTLGCLGPNQTKAFGRCGMGPCQGRFCGLTVTELIAQKRGVAPSDVGYYHIRSPIKPVTFGDFVN